MSPVPVCACMWYITCEAGNNWCIVMLAELELPTSCHRCWQHMYVLYRMCYHTCKHEVEAAHASYYSNIITYMWAWGGRQHTYNVFGLRQICRDKMGIIGAYWAGHFLGPDLVKINLSHDPALTLMAKGLGSNKIIVSNNNYYRCISQFNNYDFVILNLFEHNL